MYKNTVIIGAGLAGLQKASQLYEKGYQDILIIEHETQYGGFYGSNSSEIQSVKIVDQLLPFIWTKATVLELNQEDGHYVVTIQKQNELIELEVTNVFIATGFLEKPRSMNLIAGDRPAREMTPGLALSLINRGYLLGHKVVVFENNKASKMVIEKLSSVEECELKVKDLSDYELVEIKGNDHVRAIAIKNKETEKIEIHSCDAVVYSNGSLPNTKFLENSLNTLLDDNKFLIVNEHGNTEKENLYGLGSCCINKNALQS